MYVNSNMKFVKKKYFAKKYFNLRPTDNRLFIKTNSTKRHI